MKFQTNINNQSLELEFSHTLHRLSITHKEDMAIDCVRLSPNSYSLILKGQSYYLTVIPHLQGYEVTVDHHTHLVQVQDELDLLVEKFGIEHDGSSHVGEIHAQIPGLVSQIFVKHGDKVELNQKLFILEAMKMENEIDSPVSGTVDQIHYKAGDTVEKGI